MLIGGGHGVGGGGRERGGEEEEEGESLNGRRRIKWKGSQEEEEEQESYEGGTARAKGRDGSPAKGRREMETRWCPPSATRPRLVDLLIWPFVRGIKARRRNEVQIIGLMMILR